VSHPSLGLPPIDRISDLPPAAARVLAARERLAARALEIAIDRVVDAIAAGDPGPARAFADATPPAYRRRNVPMNDLINLSQSVRTAIGATLAQADMAAVDEAVEAMIERFKWHGRIAGDARKRNRLLAAIYKGA
jgi:hypothetical protein